MKGIIVTIDPQMIINTLGGILLIFLGYFLRDLSAKLNKVSSDNEAQSKCIAEIKLLVTGKYVTKEEQDKLINAIFKKLDTIADKVDDVKNHAVGQINEIKLTCAAVHGMKNKED